MKRCTRPCRGIDAGSYVSALINQPWSHDGRHCWRLVCDVQRDLFGRVLPVVLDVVPTGLQGRRDKPRLFAEPVERSRWMEIATPVHGAVALMHRASAPADAIIHAGVYLAIDGGGVLHCEAPQGIAFDRLIELTDVRGWALRCFIPKE